MSENPSRTGWALRAAGIATVAVAIVTAAIMFRQRSASKAMGADVRDELQSVAADIGRRPFAGRLAPPFQHIARGRATRGDTVPGQVAASQLRLQETVVRILASRSHVPSDLRNKAVALLLAGDAVDAAEQLAIVAHRVNDSGTWTDAAAANAAACDATGDLRRCIDALAAADRSLRLQVTPAARFNRALALERLGLTVEAREEWLAASQDREEPEWAAEAAANAAVLAVARTSWRADLVTFEAAAASGDSATVARLVRASPRDARAWGETVYLSGWAAAHLGNDAHRAKQQLDLARAIGAELDEFSRERLVLDAVASIDGAIAASDAARLGTLAAAHRTYDLGRRAHAGFKAVEAEKHFREATVLFARGRSPMRLIAHFFTGSAQYIQQRLPAVIETLEPLEKRRLEEQGYHALAAQIGWELGLSRLLLGQYSAALITFERSVAIFAKLHETDNRAAFDDFIAQTMELMGQPQEAWVHRKRSLGTFSQLGWTDRQLTVLWAATSLHIERKEWDRAAALAGLAVSIAAREKDSMRAAAALIQRSIIHSATGDEERARQDLVEAGRWEGTLPENDTAARLGADRAVAEGIAAVNDPARAIAEFSRAIDYYNGGGLHIFASQTLVRRAGAYRRLDRIDVACRDIDAALASLERQREGVHDVVQRTMMFTAAEEIFTEAVDLALRAGDEPGAFGFAERARGRTLLDLFDQRGLRPSRMQTRSLPLPVVQEALASDAAIVEYAILPDQTLAFVIRDSGLQVVRIAMSRDQVKRSAVGCIAEARRDDDAARGACRSASMHLVDPLRPFLQGITTVAFIPDQHLAGFPFGAASGVSGGLLGQELGIVEAPSATVAVECSRRAHTNRAAGTLAIGASAFDETRFSVEPLPLVSREVTGVAAIHGGVALEGEQVTKERITRELPLHGVIHFAGHALENATHPTESRLLIASRRPSDDLTAREIAALPLDRARLVYLSACRSGAAARRTDGLESIALSFLAAGAPSVVAARWDLPDDTAARIALDFHRAFSRDGDPAAALREAARTHGSADDRLYAASALVTIGGSKNLVHSIEGEKKP